VDLPLQTHTTPSTLSDATLSENVTVLDRGAQTFYLVGTAHVSQQSVEEVNRVIDEVQPDVVCLELCQTRYTALTDANRWRNLDIFKVIRQGKTLFLMANLAVSTYQRRLGQQLGTTPGAEMLAAAEKAKALGARVELVDRDIQVTLKRTWANISFWQKVQLVGAVINSLVTREQIEAGQVEELKHKAQLSQMMQEFAQAMPDVQVPLIDERDQYLMSKIEAAQGSKIVAVVGAGHVEGMRRYFGNKIDLGPLEVIPPRPHWVGALKWVIPLLVLAAFSIGYFKNRGKTLREMLYAWVLPNSIASAALTAVAGGKILSILAAFIGSPITSLNPLLGAGMVVGLIEAWLRKPTVQDAERINVDVDSLRGIYHNRFTRVLLVAVLSTIGSALGAWVGLSWVLSLLA